MRFALVPLFLFSIIFTLPSCVEEPTEFIEPNNELVLSYITESDGLIGGAINTFYEDEDGSIWIGTSEGVSHISNGSITNYTALDNGIIDGAILAISRDGMGDIWVSGENGYSYQFNNVWYAYSALSISSHFLDLQGNFYVGYLGGGVDIFDQNFNFTGTTYNESCFFCNFSTDIFSDPAGNIWMTSFEGVYKLSTNSSLQYLNNSNGLSEYLMAGTVDNENRIWFVSASNQSIIKLNGTQFSSLPIPVLPFEGAQSIETFEDDIFIVSATGQLLVFDGIVTKQYLEIPTDIFVNVLFKDSKGDLWVGTNGEGIIKLSKNSR